MQATDEFSIVSHKDGHVDLIRNNNDLNLRISGLILEAQYLLDDGRALIWLTEDSPYDEALYIYLLDSNNKLIDAVEGGAVFVSGILQIILIRANQITFKFFENNKTYSLIIENTPQFKLQLGEGWKYQSFFTKHYLKIEEL